MSRVHGRWICGRYQYEYGRLVFYYDRSVMIVWLRPEAGAND